MSTIEEVWADLFPGVALGAGWTTDTPNGADGGSGIQPGTLVVSGGDLTVGHPPGTYCRWDSVRAEAPLATFPLANTVNPLTSLLALEVEITHNTAGTFYCGITLYKDRQNLYGCIAGANGNIGLVHFATANVFGAAVATGMAATTRIRVYWNNHATETFTIEGSTPLTPGQVSVWTSGDLGANYAHADTRTLAIAPTALGVYGLKGDPSFTLDCDVSYVRVTRFGNPAVGSVVGPDGTARVSSKGGELLTAALVSSVGFAGLPMQAYFGPLGTAADPPCYFGQGLGYTGASADGLTVQVTAPPTTKTAAAKLTIVVDGNTLVSPATEVVERTWPAAQFTMRRNFPPWAGVGARRLTLEDLE